MLHNRQSRQAFLADRSHRIRFVFLPVHSSWLNQVETFFGIVNRKVIRRGSFESVEELSAKLEEFFEYFNATMSGPFEWTYTGRPQQSQRRSSEFTPPHRQPTTLEQAKALASSPANYAPWE